MTRTPALIVGVLLAVGVAIADAPRVGVVTGTVLDPDGKPTPGATVQLISDRGTETAVSDAQGAFRFAFVIPDTYSVRADLEGFQSAQGTIVVTAGGRADLELRLSKAMGGEILITGESPLINKFDVTGGGTVDTRELEKTVAPQRYYLSLLDYFPGVTPNASPEEFDVEGTTTYNNTFYVDGVDTSFARWGGSTLLRLPNVAVGQLQMMSSGADAEFSRSMGGITAMVVRSGGNEFSGDVTAVVQNLAWNESWTAFPNEELPNELDVRWEAAVGGPIVKDRLWFFVSAADQGTPVPRVLPSGDRMDVALIIKPWVVKADYRPSASQSLALTVADTPAKFPLTSGAAEPNAAAAFTQGGEFATLRWSWAVSDSVFLDTALAYNKTYDNRVPYGQYEADPSAPPWSPAANNDISYLDLSTGLAWNYTRLSRPGKIDHPRTQANASINWFRGDHDIKLGIDYQDTGWRDNTKAAPLIYGYGYNRNLPGGFALPLAMRRYTGTADVGGVENKSKTSAIFVRDRFTVPEHWTFNLGLRLDDQRHMNDAGTEIFKSTDLAPRATIVYDVAGDSRLLVTAEAGRYYDWIPMDMAGYFNVVPGGTAQYDQYTWVAARQDFVFLGRVTPSSNIASNTVGPSHKDEFSAGVEWAFHPNWAFKATALLKQVRDQYSGNALGGSAGYPQVVDIGGLPTVATVVENIPGAKLDRTSVTLLVRRRFRDNWTMSAAYTWSETTGNCYTVYEASCAHSFGEIRAITNEDGVPLSVVNRDGYLPNHAPHALKIRGNYVFSLGRDNTLNVGGFARYQSGYRWQLIANRTLPVPGVTPPVTETVTEYLERAGSRSLDDFYQIDLNASWRFPIVGRVAGSLGLEILNATNEQKQLFITDAGMIAGNPQAVLATALFQAPRAFRALVTLSF